MTIFNSDTGRFVMEASSREAQCEKDAREYTDAEFARYWSEEEIMSTFGVDRATLAAARRAGWLWESCDKGITVRGCNVFQWVFSGCSIAPMPDEYFHGIVLPEMVKSVLPTNEARATALERLADYIKLMRNGSDIAAEEWWSRLTGCCRSYFQSAWDLARCAEYKADSRLVANIPGIKRALKQYKTERARLVKRLAHITKEELPAVLALFRVNRFNEECEETRLCNARAAQLRIQEARKDPLFADWNVKVE